jgi:hypothetical protein
LNLNRPEVTAFSTIGVHRISAGWGEGDSNAGDPGGGGAPSAPGDATWIHRSFPDTLWNTNGGDFVSTSSAQFTPPALGIVSVSSSGTRDDVQAWIDAPTANHGWLFLVPGKKPPLNSAMRFNSRESPEALRPTLRLVFRAGGDATADDRVNIQDFAILAANFNQPLAGPNNGDFNRSGTVEIQDFAILAANFNLDLNRLSADETIVPEPSAAIGMLVFVAAGSVRPRERRSSCPCA